MEGCREYAMLANRHARTEGRRTQMQTQTGAQAYPHAQAQTQPQRSGANSTLAATTSPTVPRVLPSSSSPFSSLAPGTPINNSHTSNNISTNITYNPNNNNNDTNSTANSNNSGSSTSTLPESYDHNSKRRKSEEGTVLPTSSETSSSGS